MKIDFAPAGRRAARAYAITAVRPICAEVRRETAKAYLLDTGLRCAWVPKRLVSRDEAQGVFMIPQWLTVEKVLD